MVMKIIMTVMVTEGMIVMVVVTVMRMMMMVVPVRCHLFYRVCEVPPAPAPRGGMEDWKL